MLGIKWVGPHHHPLNIMDDGGAHQPKEVKINLNCKEEFIITKVGQQYTHQTLAQCGEEDIVESKEDKMIHPSVSHENPSVSCENPPCVTLTDPLFRTTPTVAPEIDQKFHDPPDRITNPPDRTQIGLDLKIGKVRKVASLFETGSDLSQGNLTGRNQATHQPTTTRNPTTTITKKPNTTRPTPNPKTNTLCNNKPNPKNQLFTPKTHHPIPPNNKLTNTLEPNPQPRNNIQQPTTTTFPKKLPEKPPITPLENHPLFKTCLIRRPKEQDKPNQPTSNATPNQTTGPKPKHPNQLNQTTPKPSKPPPPSPPTCQTILKLRPPSSEQKTRLKRSKKPKSTIEDTKNQTKITQYGKKMKPVEEDMGEDRATEDEVKKKIVQVSEENSDSKPYSSDKLAGSHSSETSDSTEKPPTIIKPSRVQSFSDLKKFLEQKKLERDLKIGRNQQCNQPPNRPTPTKIKMVPSPNSTREDDVLRQNLSAKRCNQLQKPVLQRE